MVSGPAPSSAVSARNERDVSNSGGSMHREEPRPAYLREGHSAGHPRKIRLCIMTTIGASIQVLYAGRLEYLSANGFDITVACASSDLDQAIRVRGVRLRTFAFTRAITLWKDARVLAELYRFLRDERFDLVEVSTPKAALIGSLAARLARSRCLIHFLLGTAYEGKRGLLGAVLRVATSIPCRIAHVTYAVSSSVAERILADHLGRPERIRVLGPGSSTGVDLVRFSQKTGASSAQVRRAHHIPLEAVVIGFVGRLTRDKGVDDLARAFGMLNERWPDTVLVVVGNYEDRDRPAVETSRMFSTHPGVRHVGWQADVIPFMAAMNIFCLPTYREGLGNVLLEAAAMGLPTVTTNATGACDAIIAGKTGLQVPIGDPDALAAALATLVRDPSLRKEMGRAGRAWVCERFDQNDVFRRQADEYRALAASLPHL
jgi:glycosyltransferase involved in cell wall biosynthesis